MASIILVCFLKDSNQRNTVNMKNNKVILGFSQSTKPDSLMFNPGLFVYVSMSGVNPGLLNPELNKPE